jgi:hypothetical protein
MNLLLNRPFYRLRGKFFSRVVVVGDFGVRLLEYLALG